MARGNYRTIYEIIAITSALLTLFLKFFKVVVDKGRLVEFFISTPLLIATYYLMAQIPLKNEWVLLYLFPFTCYAIYWSITLTAPQKESYNSQLHWADENWWWSLDGWQFEEEVAKVFRKNGYKVQVTKKTGDGGADIILYKNKRKIIAQCKHYTSPVGPEPVRALWGIKEDLRADDVYMIASSGVTKSSEKFMKNKANYKLYTLADIIRLSQKLQF